MLQTMIEIIKKVGYIGETRVEDMKRNVENSHELLKHLVLRGDPQAFFLLCKPYLTIRYRKERNNGSSDQDACSKIIAEAAELFEQVQGIRSKSFDAWFEEHCTMPDSSSTEADIKTSVDKKTAADTATFLNLCSRELIRKASEIKRISRKKQRSLPYLFFKNRIAVSVWILIIISAVILGGGFLIVKRGIVIAVSLKTPKSRFSVSFPPHAKDENNTDRTGTPIPNQNRNTTDTSDAGNNDSIQTKTVSKTLSISEPKKVGPQRAAEKKSLPPVVPKARLILPPPPPNPIPSGTTGSENIQSAVPTAPETTVPTTSTSASSQSSYIASPQKEQTE